MPPSGEAGLTGPADRATRNQLRDLFIQIQAGGNPPTAFLRQGLQLSRVRWRGNALRAVAGR